MKNYTIFNTEFAYKLYFFQDGIMTIHIYRKFLDRQFGRNRSKLILIFFLTKQKLNKQVKTTL